MIQETLTIIIKVNGIHRINLNTPVSEAPHEFLHAESSTHLRSTVLSVLIVFHIGIDCRTNLDWSGECQHHSRSAGRHLRPVRHQSRNRGGSPRHRHGARAGNP